ncbi:hypothetical protein PanWU01x14_320440 [Parasponia andersonii]|uniref:Uncharacterized protein n=1 Tax=Parasponia andersonii TaxID=3476 RepID=A0A2P5ALK2_PARAD|nr:hypothetical protein PanWU01x14_320440 [Parasponia andersonii]
MKDKDSIEREDDNTTDPNVTTSIVADIIATTFGVLARVDNMERMLTAIYMMIDMDIADTSQDPPTI